MLPLHEVQVHRSFPVSINVAEQLVEAVYGRNLRIYKQTYGKLTYFLTQYMLTRPLLSFLFIML
jgi:hypothetical protein